MRTEPHPALRNQIRLYQGYVGRSRKPVKRRELPFGCITLILNFGLRYRLFSGASPGESEMRGSFLAGLHDRYVVVENACIDRCLHVDFTPLGALRLLRAPMHLVSGRTVEISALFGAESDRLMSQLADAHDWSARFAILDRWILARMQRARPASAEVAWAWRRLEDSRGAIRVSDLAGALDWSRKRLVATFRDQVGVPPKSLARILRFQNAIGRLAQDGSGAADVAAACGYADQPHMVRELVAMSGLSPTGLRARGLGGSGGLIDP